MSSNPKPQLRPSRPYFSSGPCVKPSSWKLDSLENALIGRSHRSDVAKERLRTAVTLTRQLLQIPKNYFVAITPASDTGAVEMALWSLLGARPVTVMSWDHFGREWMIDIIEQLKLKEVQILNVNDGQLPDFSQLNFLNDIVFTWNGTSAGACIPNADFIPNEREGLTICDATSAAFGQALDFSKLDVTTFSWQKVLGSEAAHGIIVLSPRAVERLKTYTPSWPIPKIFRLVQNGQLIQQYFESEPINTPSMLCVEDYLYCLQWGLQLGGLDSLIDRCNRNATVVWDFIEKSSWLDHLVERKEARSNTVVCMKIVDPWFLKLNAEQALSFINNMLFCLAEEHVAYDIHSYKTAPLGLRIWTGATVEINDLKNMLPWLTWAFFKEKNSWN